MQGDLKELSDKIVGVELKVTEKLGEVLAGISGMNATMTATFDRVKEVQSDMEKVKEKSTKALDSTNSAHKRLDTLEKEMKPLTDSNMVDRINKIEANFRWVVTTVIGAVILAVLGFILVTP